MTDVPAPLQPAGGVPSRLVALDTLSAILPLDRRDQLAEILSDDEISTLRHLAQKGMGANTLRAMASDLAYLEAWSRAADGDALSWPAPEAVVLRFVAHHLWDPAQRARDAGHGMPQRVRDALTCAGRLRSGGPHAVSTVRRRMALWATFHRWRGLDGPFSSPNVRNALRLAAMATSRPRGRKSARAVTRDILDRLLATCAAGRLIDTRDRALLLIAFGSGGRRRSEVAKLMVEDLVERAPVPARRGDPIGAATVRSLGLRLGRTKTAGADQDERVVVVGRPVEALLTWLTAAGIVSGAIFRRIDRWDRLGEGALDGQSVNAIVKKRCALAGLDPTAYSAHGLRSGYLTEAARRGVPLQEAMRQTRHRSMQQASSYYNEVEIERGESARLG